MILQCEVDRLVIFAENPAEGAKLERIKFEIIEKGGTATTDLRGDNNTGCSLSISLEKLGPKVKV